MWSFFMPFSIIILLLIIKGKSKSRKIYAIISFIIGGIFIFRFACDNISCVSNIFFWDLNSKCENICNQCNSFAEENISIIEYNENEDVCNNCKKCNADWNIRAAFDPSSIIFLGMIFSMFFLYKKNYPVKELLKGLSTINLFGLSFKVSEIEKTVDSLSNEMQSELSNENIQMKAAEINTTIHKKAGTPFSTLHLFIEKLELEYNKLDNIFKQKENVISQKKQEQFERLAKAIQNLFDFVKNDWTNKYINRVIMVAKKILILLYNLLDYFHSPPPSNKAKYLRDNIGVDIVKNKYSVIINKGSTIPVEKSGIYHTTKNNQTSIKSKILFGHNSVASKNKLIGNIEISGIPPLPAKKGKITILFKIDKFGLLIAKQICHNTGKIVQEEFNINEYLAIEKE